MNQRATPNDEKQLQKHKFFDSIGFFIKSSFREARRRKLYFFLAMISTLIVVAATAVTQTAIGYTPLIFLKLAESSVGRIDATISSVTRSFWENDVNTKRYVTKPLYLNGTAIQTLIDPIYPEAMAPRYTFSSVALIVTPKDNLKCNNLTSPPYNSCMVVKSTLVLQNTERENELGMSQDYQLPSDIPLGGLIISDKIAQAAQIGKGDQVILQMDTTDLLKDVNVQYNSRQSNMTTKISDFRFNRVPTYLPFQIADIIKSLDGKFSHSAASDIMIAEQKYFFSLLSQNMPNITANRSVNYPAYLKFLKNENPLNYADTILFNINNRQDVYRESNFDIIQDETIEFASKISNALGVFPYTIRLPVYGYLSDLRYAGMYLGLALNIIVVILFVLSTILIYNILLVTVETKTFEFGVIRMVGLTKVGIAQLILVQALSFVIPGIILGLVVSIPLLMFVSQKLQSFIQSDIPIFPTGEALFWSIFIGFLIPLISSYYPVKEALGKHLNATLDHSHSKTNAIQISIEITAKAFPWAQVTFALLSVAFGVAVYILLPLSLLSFDVGLILGLFFAILIGFLVGLTFLSLNFEHFMGKLITTVFFFWTKSAFRSLIAHNLIAHKLRNRQTMVMYSLALGFIIFIVVSLRQQLSNMQYQVEAEHGADIELKITDSILDYALIEKTLKVNLTDAVESYAWITQDLVTYAQGYQNIEVTHRGQLYTVSPYIRGVSPHIFKTIQQDFLVVDEVNQKTELDLGQQLYTPRGAQGAIVGSAYKEKLGLSLESNDPIVIQFKNGTNIRTEELRIIATLDTAAGFTFSKLPSQDEQDVLVSLPTFLRLADNISTSMDFLPAERLLIKVKDSSDANADKIMKQFSDLQKREYSGLEIWDVRDSRDSLKTNQNALNFIFTGLEVVAMLLSMFSLVSSMSTNILEQTKEIAVLKGIGFRKVTINLLYVSEAFVIVLSSSIFGVLIGTCIAWILASQGVLFTQLPLFFSFPIVDCGIILIAAVVSAFLSSYMPAHRITKLTIAKVVRL